jgi:hypothetical protein
MLQYDWLWSGHMIIKEMFHIPMKLKSELACASMTTDRIQNISCRTGLLMVLHYCNLSSSSNTVQSSNWVLSHLFYLSKQLAIFGTRVTSPFHKQIFVCHMVHIKCIDDVYIYYICKMRIKTYCNKNVDI